MDELNLVPMYRNGIGEITPGIDIPVPEFCRNNCTANNKCIKYYRKLESAETGMYICPYGFSSYVFKIEDDNFIFTCLRIENHYNRDRLIPKIKKEKKEYRELTRESVEKYADAYRDFFINQYKFENYRKFIEDIFHDIRKYNQQIKIKGDKIYKKAQQSKRMGDFLEIAKSIQQLGWFLTLRLNNHDLIYNEGLLGKDGKSFYNIYNIVYKVKKCIEEKADEKNIKIYMNANHNCRDMQAYDCIELLPYILLDNAIKYSPKNETINIEIKETREYQRVTIDSIGPVLYDSEKDKVYKQGYRGINASSMTDDGMGRGLYTAKGICEQNGIDININSSPDVYKTISNIPYSKFTVDFSIKL